MKLFRFEIEDSFFSDFFFAVRSKSDVIKVQMNAIKYMQFANQISSDCSAELCLYIDKMCRLIFVSDSKIYSVNFPFRVTEINGQVIFNDPHLGAIDSKHTSDVLSVLNDDSFSSGNCMYDFMDGLTQYDESNPQFWSFLLRLFLNEDGYVRFDHDEQQVNGLLHPLDHIDVFYSNSATFKLGVDSQSRFGDVVDILNRGTACHYLSRR